jgi:hypothetical protein
MFYVYCVICLNVDLLGIFIMRLMMNNCEIMKDAAVLRSNRIGQPEPIGRQTRCQHRRAARPQSHALHSRRRRQREPVRQRDRIPRSSRGRVAQRPFAQVLRVEAQSAAQETTATIVRS